MTECIQRGCINGAAYILVDYSHNVIGGGETYCEKHAFIDGREECPCCGGYFIEFDGEEFLPTYPQGSLDNDGCCSEHP